MVISTYRVLFGSAFRNSFCRGRSLNRISHALYLSSVDDLHDLDALLLEVLQHLDHGPCPLGRVLPVLVKAELATK